MALLGAFVLIAHLGLVYSQNPNCDYFQQVTPGQQYYIYSPGYPNNYSGGQQCRWTAQCPSGYNCKLDCSEINLPQSQGCNQDRLLVSKTGDPQLSGAEYYCGLGSLTATSQAQRMTVGLITPTNTRGGRFVCQLTAVAAGGGGGGGGGSCRCGWKRSNRIVGGVETGVNEFPFMVGLVNGQINAVKCGGSLISDRHALSAAHCLAYLPMQSTLVLVGEHDITTGDSPATQAYRVSSFTIHPNYNPSTYDYDIGIVTTQIKMTFSDLVGPICLPFKFANVDLTGRLVTVMGWGTQSFGGPTSDVLMKADLRVISRAQCQQSVTTVTPRQLCTYTPGKDACQDDSGGPVVFTDSSTGLYNQAGLISFGSLCASGRPGISTNVATLLPWIQANTPGVNYCRP